MLEDAYLISFESILASNIAMQINTAMSATSIFLLVLANAGVCCTLCNLNFKEFANVDHGLNSQCCEFFLRYIIQSLSPIKNMK